MLVRTLLNRCHKLKSLVYDQVRLELVSGLESIVVRVVPRKNSRGLCSQCVRPAGTYDHQPAPRLFRFVPLWGWTVYLEYRMRRVSCPIHGVVVEHVPWAEGKRPVARCMEVFLARWARRLSWKEVAECFGACWQMVFRSVRSVVDYGLRHRSLDGVQSIGVDEVHFGKGSQFLTVVYQIDAEHRRLLDVSPGRTVRSFLRFFDMMGAERAAQIRFVCSDMWRPYLKVIAEKIPNALHVLDRFHIVANLNKALNEIRAAEARRLRAEGYENVLKNAKYCLLKRKENLTSSAD